MTAVDRLKRVLLCLMLIVILLPSRVLAVDTAALDRLLEQAKDYDFGKSRQGLVQIERIIRDASNADAPSQALIEKQLLGLLATDGALGLKDFLCRQLSLIGTDQSVEALVSMVNQPDTADMARYALERIGSEAVAKQLGTLLTRAQIPDKTKIGVIATLGAKRDAGSVSLLINMLDHSNADVVKAAAAALGSIGTAEAAAGLTRKKDDQNGEIQARLIDGLLQCAETMALTGETAQAKAIYDGLYSKKYASLYRMAALKGLAKTDPKQAGTLIGAALKQHDEDVLTAAISLVATLDNQADIRAAVRTLPDLSESAQVQMLTVLGESKVQLALSSVTQFTRAKVESVQIAALKTLGQIGDTSSVGVLASAAGSLQDAAQATARASLYTLSSSGVDGEIVRRIPDADRTTKIELIRSVSERQIKSGIQSLIQSANDSNRTIRSESFRALATIATPSQLPALVELLLTRPGPAAEDAVVVVSNRLTVHKAKAVLDRADSARKVDAKKAVLKVLARIGDDRGLDYVLKHTQGSDSPLRTEAVRALSQWPTATPIKELLDIATHDSNMTCRILALRGYINTVAVDTRQTPQQRTRALVAVSQHTRRSDEKVLILGALPKCACVEALDYAEAQVANAGIRVVAQMAVVRICEALPTSESDRVQSVLNKILAGKPSKAAEKLAKDILKKQK